MAEKTSQANSSSNNLPNIPAVAPTSDTPYIQPVIGKLGYDTKHPEIFGLGSSPDNGASFHVWASFGGIVLDKDNMDAIWINGVSDRVKSEVNSATAEIPQAVSNANEAVKKADSAVANSKVNSDAIKAMQSAASEAVAGANEALSNAQTAINNVASLGDKVTSAQSANDSRTKAMQADLDKAKQSISDTSKRLANVSANLDTYAKSAAEQGHDITELKKQQGKIEADLASANGNVTQLQATVSGIQGNLKDTNDNVDALSATASQAGVALQNAQSQVAQVIARADKFQAAIAEQDKKIVDIKATADGASVAASNANSTATEAKLTASAASVTASDAKSEVLTVTATASDAKLLATNANSQAMRANATASSVSVNLSGVEKTANQAKTTADSNAKQISNVVNTVTSVNASIKATQKELSGKVNQTTVDTLSNTVKQQQAQQQVLADQIKTKVTSSDVKGILADGKYATQDYTQTLVNQTSRTLSASITEVQRNADSNHQADVNRMTNLQASIDGLQSTVANKADQSQITQLTNVVQSKVSSKDYQTAISQLTDDINARVAKGDLITQINLEAGRALFQSNKIFLDADSVVFSKNSKAFIPSAAITNLEADKVTTGTLNGVEIRQLETGGRSIDIKNGNIAIASNDPYEPRISFTNNGKDAKMFNAVGDIEVLNQEFVLFNFTPEDTHSLNPIPFFKVTNTGQIGSGGAQLNMDHAIFDGYEWWTPSAGVTFGRTWNGVDKSSDYADIYAKSFVPHSELSAKTRIKKLDRKEALDKIMQDDMYTYQFKEDVRDGVSKRYASFIIDNVHDVAQYAEPEEFLSANGKGRDDGTQLAYLIAAVQYQQEQIEELKKKLEEK